MAWLIGGFFVASGLFAALVLARITRIADQDIQRMIERQKEPLGI